MSRHIQKGRIEAGPRILAVPPTQILNNFRNKRTKY